MRTRQGFAEDADFGIRVVVAAPLLRVGHAFWCGFCKRNAGHACSSQQTAQWAGCCEQATRHAFGAPPVSNVVQHWQYRKWRRCSQGNHFHNFRGRNRNSAGSADFVGQFMVKVALGKETIVRGADPCRCQDWSVAASGADQKRCKTADPRTIAGVEYFGDVCFNLAAGRAIPGQKGYLQSMAPLLTGDFKGDKRPATTARRLRSHAAPSRRTYPMPRRLQISIVAPLSASFLRNRWVSTSIALGVGGSSKP